MEFLTHIILKMQLILHAYMLIFGQISLKFESFGGVLMGSQFDFGLRTMVRVSSKSELSSSKMFDVRYIWV